MTDPAIEPESGLSYHVLYDRLWVVYLALLKQMRDVLDARPSEDCRELVQKKGQRLRR